MAETTEKMKRPSYGDRGEDAAMSICIRKEIISGCEGRDDAKSPYLTRWHLLDAFGFSVRLHKFHRSDFDDLHDHPWSFVSLILWGGYIEETPCERCGTESSEAFPEICNCRHRRFIHPGTLLYRKATHVHRVVLVDGKPSWSLVITGKRKRAWGFFTRDGWKRWTDYFKEMGC